NNEVGQNIASRKIVLSTIGILAGIRKFAQESKQLRLAWSLVAPNDALRKKLIPFKGLASIEETIAALKEYQKATKRRITIEYVVLKGVNDSQADIKELAKIANKLDSHINLIPYNNSPGSVFESGDVDQIRSKLKKINQSINVTIRNSLGQDISAACGQLATLIK
ncbi:MAG: 23S rRNA (adenine(2503)-C(2))-methyltransferase RlmN, partial [Candidatus Margulisbacteria bacterium]|nr:23S rRNA (adenine(2503)-C(2))-methyltransferase RlmN [Candidatus Margulisiibacteriota bacterium]